MPINPALMSVYQTSFSSLMEGCTRYGGTDFVGGDERVCTGRVRASSVQLRLSPGLKIPLKPEGGAPYKKGILPF